jgi:Spy/CpxP family protein refolding chaperone
MMGPSMLNLVCSPRGAERLEHVFVAVSHRAAITDAQKPAFDALKTAALSAQTDYADTCKASFDAIRADGKPDPIKALQARLAVDSARVEALTAILPKIEDFYKTLTPEQKTALQPSRRQGMNNERHWGNDRNGRHHQRPQTTDQVAPAAPTGDSTGKVEG